MSTPRTTLVDAWQMLGKAEGDPQGAGYTVMRQVTDIDVTAIDTLYATALAETRTTALKMDGQSYSGTFIVATVTALQDAQRIGTIQQVLTKVRDLSEQSYIPTETMWQVSPAARGVSDAHKFGLQLVRECKYIDPAQAKSVLAALLAIESYDGVTGTPTGPKADSVLWGYLFINSSVDAIKEKDETVTIRQTLTRMVTYAAESTANTPAHADWVLVQNPATPDDAGRTLVREIRYLDPQVAQATLAVVAGTASYTDPKADNVARTGTFWNSACVAITQADRTVTLRQTLTLTASTTAEADAKLVSSQGTPDDAGHTLMREWRFIDPASADGLFVALNAVASYSGPKADNQAYTGTYWNSRVNPIKAEDGTVTIRQTLTLTASSTAEANAKLSEPTIGDPQIGGFQLAREWRFLDPTAADTLFTTALAVTSVTGPKADNQTYSGTFAVATLAPQKQADGTVTLKQVLTKVTELSGLADQAATYAALAAVTPRVDRGKVQVNIEQLAGWQSSYETVTMVYENLTVASEDVLMKDADAKYISDANLITEADANSDDQAWTVLGRKFEKTTRNVGVFTVNLIEGNYVAYSAGNRIQTGLDNKLGYVSTGATVGMQRIDTVRGLAAASVAADVVAQAVTSGYVIDSVRSSLDRGESVITVVQTKVDDYGTGTTAAGGVLAPTEITQQDAVGRQEAGKQYIFRFVSPSRIATIITAAKTIANYQHANWFTLGATYAVDQTNIEHLANGSAHVRATLRAPFFNLTVDTYNADTNVDYDDHYQTDRVAKSISGSPGIGIPYKRLVKTSIVSHVYGTFAEAQGFLKGDDWTGTPWSTDLRYIVFASAVKMGRGINTIKLATGAQVYKGWVRVFYEFGSWAAE